MNEYKKIWGIVAEFDNPESLLSAAKSLRRESYKKFECHSPFPIHGMDEAAGEKRSKVSLVAGIMAIIGGVSALVLQGWSSTIAYPLVISGKPFFSYQAFFPVTFALAVLLAALGALLGLFRMMDLKFHHWLFNSDTFSKFSDDGFIVSVESGDPKFDPEKTTEFLKSLGGSNIEIVGVK